MTRWREVRDDLAARIRSGEYAPGALLPSIRALMAQWDVANKTVERAMRELVDEGLVESEPQRGYRVTGVDGGSLAARVARLEAGQAEIRRHLGLDGQPE